MTYAEFADVLGYEVHGEHTAGGASVDPRVADPGLWEPRRKVTVDRLVEALLAVIPGDEDPIAVILSTMYARAWLAEAKPSWVRRAYEDVAWWAFPRPT